MTTLETRLLYHLREIVSRLQPSHNTLPVMLGDPAMSNGHIFAARELIAQIDAINAGAVPLGLPPGHVKCRVEWHQTAWLVTFEDGGDLLLQSDWDQVAFAVACGAVPSPESWDGRPSTLPGWEGFEPDSIESCPDEYLPEKPQPENPCPRSPSPSAPMNPLPPENGLPPTMTEST